MKRVYASESLVEIGHLKNVLEQDGIASVIRNEQLSGAMGEVPFLECMPELWICDDTHLDRALALIAGQNTSQAVAAEAWLCRACGERNEGNFAACWRCGAEDIAG